MEGITYEANLHHIEKRSENDYSWFGHMEGSALILHFNANGDARDGEVWGPWELHRSLITRGGRTFLVEWSEEMGRPLENDQVSVSSISSRLSVSVKEKVQEIEREVLPYWPRIPRLVLARHEEIRISYAYDETTKNEMLAWGQLSADRINATNLNSQMGGSYHVTLAGTRAFAYKSAGKLSADFAAIRDSPEIKAWRDEDRIDVVMLAVDPSEPDKGGVATLFGSGERYGFCVVFMDMGAEVAAHEFGPPLGAQHQPEAPDAPEGTKRGHWVNGYFRDAVSVPLPNLCILGCPVIPFWSNPKVLYDGFPTGMNDRENVKAVTDAWDVVAQYRK